MLCRVTSLVRASGSFHNLAFHTINVHWKALWIKVSTKCHSVMSKRRCLGLVQLATSLFFHLAWMLLLALIVILSTLHSPGSGGWPGCVLEHSKHQTQIGTKSHYFSAGCIMGQVVGRGESTFSHYDWAGIKNHQKSDCSTYGKLARRCWEWPVALYPAPHGMSLSFIFNYK